MRYNPRFNVVISGDDKGGLEYWSAKTYKPPKKVVKFRFKVRWQRRGPGVPVLKCTYHGAWVVMRVRVLTLCHRLPSVVTDSPIRICSP